MHEPLGESLTGVRVEAVGRDSNDSLAIHSENINDILFNESHSRDNAGSGIILQYSIYATMYIAILVTYSVHVALLPAEHSSLQPLYGIIIRCTRQSRGGIAALTSCHARTHVSHYIEDVVRQVVI